MDQLCIGTAAGVIWQFLRDNGPENVSIASLKKLADLKPDEALAGIGWLAREGKLCFVNDKGKSCVTLVQGEFAGVC